MAQRCQVVVELKSYSYQLIEMELTARSTFRAKMYLAQFQHASYMLGTDLSPY